MRHERFATDPDPGVRFLVLLSIKQIVWTFLKVLKGKSFVFKGGDPAAGSPTATLLRLHPSHEPHRGNRPPEG